MHFLLLRLEKKHLIMKILEKQLSFLKNYSLFKILFNKQIWKFKSIKNM
jgi:hypothetical protein